MASFVKKDLDILSGQYSVYSFHFQGLPKWMVPFSFFRQVLALVRNIRSCDLYVTQFAGYPSVLPVLLARLCGKKSIIILGGTDCNWLPSIGYGNFHKKWLSKATVYSLTRADMLLPVNKELVYTPYTYETADGPCQGYQCFFPSITTPYRVIPNGVDLSAFGFSTSPRNKQTFLSICSGIESSQRRKVKGIDLVLAVASHFPDCTFLLIGGKLPPDVHVPPNVTVMDFCQQEQLPRLLQETAFYIQLSLTEGFPNALIEAMGCGCVPIVSAVGAMPEIATSSGFILQQRNTDQLIGLITEALSSYGPDRVIKARKKAEEFSIERRRAELLEAIASMMH